MFERTVQPVLDVKTNQSQHSGRFKLTTFICNVWIDSTCTIFNRTAYFSSIIASGIELCYTYLLPKLKFQHIWDLALLSSHQSLQD